MSKIQIRVNVEGWGRGTERELIDNHGGGRVLSIVNVPLMISHGIFLVAEHSQARVSGQVVCS